MTFQLTSSAFADGQTIPRDHTGDGANRSPPLAWSNPPDGTVSFALICDDPDAPRRTWVHWVIFNLPGDLRGLDGGIPTAGLLADGTIQGKNDFGNLGYGGPAPPRGKPHRYFFKLYALDTRLTVPAGATRDQVLEAIKGHVLAEARTMGQYQR
jgi:Raf kinase inhibitor-like YbhB/YbcL family protein